MSTPNSGIPYVPEGTLDPAAGLNDALDVIDALLQTAVISMAMTAPPGSPIDGDLYIPAAPATGAWVGLENYLVRYREEGAFWQSFAPGMQVKLVLNLDDLGLYRFEAGSPGVWMLAAGLGDAPSSGGPWGREGATWVEVGGAITVVDANDSPEIPYTDIETLKFGGGAVLVEESPGVVRIEAGTGSGGFPAQLAYQGW